LASPDGFEPDDDASQASSILLDGTPQEHSIHLGSDVDWVTFTLADSSGLTIETDGPSGDTELWLYGPDNWTDEIAYDDQGGNGSFSKIAVSLEPGTYDAKVG